MDKRLIEVEQVRVLDSVPSGSGLVVHGRSLFIVGDDATALYKLDLDGIPITRIPLLHSDTSVHRIAKPDKHDLEAVAIVGLKGGDHLLAFGSGSVSPQRDSLLVIDIGNPSMQQWISLGSLYTQLRSLSRAKELNLEGAVINGDACYLLNRSGNEIFVIKTADLVRLIETGGAHDVTNIQTHMVDLPAGAFLSGGCMRHNEILFCASAENTPNAYDDGAIEGSYMGIIDPRQEFRLKLFVRIIHNGKNIKDKIESLDIAGTDDNGNMKVLAVADNDDGTSRLYEMRVSRR